MLLGCNFDTPVSLSQYWDKFMQYSVYHPHGWGIAMTKPNIIIKGANCAINNPLALQLASKGIISTNALFHLRQASCGNVALRNTHPFTKGKWVFAHNGTINTDIEVTIEPRGETDSELAFLYLYEQLVKTKYHWRIIKKVAHNMDGGFNFLLMRKNNLYAYYSGHNSLFFTKTNNGYLICTLPILKQYKWHLFPKRMLIRFKDGKINKYERI